MLPVLIGLGIAYLASEAVSKNNDKKKRQAMQANHVSKVKQLENRINKLKNELKQYGAEIETAKAITEKNLKKLDDMLLALKRVEKNLGDTSFTGASSASASLLVFGNSLQRAIERKKLQEKYDQQVAVLETAIRRLNSDPESSGPHHLATRRVVEWWL